MGIGSFPNLIVNGSKILCYQLPFCPSEVLSVVFAGVVCDELVRLLALSFAFAASARALRQKQM
jgi:hypothetical protein